MPHFRYDGFTEVKMHSEGAKLSGQNERSSGNYLFTDEAFAQVEKVKIACPAGVTFDFKMDHTAGKDEYLEKGVASGRVLNRNVFKGGKGVYIANPKGTNGQAFEVVVTAV